MQCKGEVPATKGEGIGAGDENVGKNPSDSDGLFGVTQYRDFSSTPPLPGIDPIALEEI